MTDRVRQWLTKHAVAVFAVLMVGISALGIALMFLKQHVFHVFGHELAVKEEVFHLLGHALVIAGILGLTVDVFLKAKLMRDITHNLARYLFGHEVPVEIRDRLYELMRADRVYRNFEIRCRLTEIVDKPGFVSLEVALSNDVDNITNRPLSFVDELEYDEHEAALVLEMRCDSADAKANYRKTGADLGKNKEGDPGTKVASGKKVAIPALNRDKGCVYRFGARYRIEYSIRDSELIVFRHHTFGASVIFEAPDDYKITVSPKTNIHNVERWSYTQLFLPGESVRIRWSKMLPEQLSFGSETARAVAPSFE